MTLTRKYRVWDPDVETCEDARVYDAANIAHAAEQYAEADSVDWEMYTGNGHALQVLDEHGDAHECVVVMEQVPTYNAQVRRRV